MWFGGAWCSAMPFPFDMVGMVDIDGGTEKGGMCDGGGRIGADDGNGGGIGMGIVAALKGMVVFIRIVFGGVPVMVVAGGGGPAAVGWMPF